MATTLYCRNNAALPALTPPIGPALLFTVKDTARGITPGDATVYAPSAPLRLNSAVGTGTGLGVTFTGVTGPTSGVLGGANQAFFSDPVAADVTVSGNVTFAFCGSESNMNNNMGWQGALYRLDNNGALTAIVNNEFGTEMGTSQGRGTWSAAPTSTDMKIGDRFVLIPLVNDAGGTMAGGTATLNYNGSTANTADTNVQLTETVTFLTADPTGTTYYLRSTASDITPGSAVSKALSTTQGAGTVTAQYTTIAGPIAFPGQQWTSTAGGTEIEWYTPPLNAFTLSGAVKATLGGDGTNAQELAITPFDPMSIELAVVDSDGGGAKVWATSCFINNATTANQVRYLTGPTMPVATAQRLRLRVYQDDYLGTAGTSNQVAGTTRTIRYDGTSTYAATLIFTQTIQEGGLPPVVINQAPMRAACW